MNKECDTFWFFQPCALIGRMSFVPLSTNTLNQNLNILSRIIIVLFLISLIFCNLKLTIMIIVWFVCICIIGLCNKRNQPRESFQSKENKYKEDNFPTRPFENYESDYSTRQYTEDNDFRENYTQLDFEPSSSVAVNLQENDNYIPEIYNERQPIALTERNIRMNNLLHNENGFRESLMNEYYQQLNKREMHGSYASNFNAYKR